MSYNAACTSFFTGTGVRNFVENRYMRLFVKNVISGRAGNGHDFLNDFIRYA